MFRRTLYLFLATVLLSSLIDAEEFLECENEALGIFIAVASNCTKAIYCNGADSTIVECDSSNPFFSPDDEMCYNNATVCGSRPFSGENLANTIPTVSLPTAPTTFATTSAASTTVRITSAPTLASNSFPATGSTSPSATAAIFTIPIATSATTAPIILPSTTAPITSATFPTTLSFTDPFKPLQCPAVDDPTRPLFLPDPKSCSQYYLCYHGVATVMQCPNMLHFDVSQQSCNTAERANCQIYAVVPRDQCLANTVDVYPHSSNCNYYYICEYGFLMVMQCPFNMGWDYERKTCAIKSKAKCYNAAFLD